jgi:protein gp37
MRTTKIEWTERTWNPVTGCSKVSEGCRHCYAESMTRRLFAMGNNKYRNNFVPTEHPEDLQEPYRWKRPSTVFVCSMSDIFNEKISFDFIDKIFAVIRDTPQHTYQILTKRAKRMAEYFKDKEIPYNAWIGVTVENRQALSRIDSIRALKTKVKFLSCEPLLEDLGEMNLEGINWIIVGGESGVSARPMDEKWVESIRTQANKYSIPFFFKQWGTWGRDKVKRNKQANGKLLGGEIVQEYPNI